MKYLITIIVLTLLLKLIVDDFRHRTVSLVWLALLAVCTTVIYVVSNGLHEFLTRVWQNTLLLAYMGAGVVVWTWIRERRLVNPVNRYIGLGDLLFFLALVPLFPVIKLAWLIVVCMIFSLAWWQVARWAGSSPRNIPLVATSGIVTGATMILNLFLE